MIVPLLRHVAARLEDATTGVNASLATIPLEAGDTAPSGLVVKTAADHPAYALGPVDESLRAAGTLVLVTHVQTQPAETGKLNGRKRVTVALRYVAPFSATFAHDAYLVLAACERALVGPSVTGGMAAQDVVRSGVRIGAPVEAPTLVEPPPDAPADAYVPALVLTYSVLSPWTYGA